MADPLSQVWFVFLFSLIAALVVFPLVVTASFLYESLVDKYRKTPKILLMLVSTFVATLVAVVVIELYLGFALGELFTG